MEEKKKRVLFVASVVKTHMMQFHIPCLKMFQEMGWETTVAARNDYEDPGQCNIPYCDEYFNIPFSRSPFSLQNIQAFKELKEIIDRGDYQIIHCHTPIGGVVGRLAAGKARRNGTKVIYTAHGFHFFKGGPLQNWVYYFVEKFLSRKTDVLLTINQEDYERAQRRFHAKETLQIPGVGIDTARFRNAVADRQGIRSQFGVSCEDTLLISVGEVRDLKNHKAIIEAVHQLKNSRIHYFIVGAGEAESSLRDMARDLHVEKQIHFLGYRNDVHQLLKVSDIFCFPSYREGLPAALMEAMASGVPVVASQVRGNTDLVADGVNGFLCSPKDVSGFAEKISILMQDRDLAQQFVEKSLHKIQGFDQGRVLELLKDVYGLNSAV